VWFIELFAIVRRILTLSYTTFPRKQKPPFRLFIYDLGGGGEKEEGRRKKQSKR